MYSYIEGVLVDTKILTSVNDKSYIKLYLDDIIITDENENEIDLNNEGSFMITAWPSDLVFIQSFCRREVSQLDIEEVNSIIRGIFLEKTVIIKARTKETESGMTFYNAKEIKLQ